MDQPNKSNRSRTPTDVSDIICGVSALSNENRQLKEQVRMLENVNHSLLEEQERLQGIILELSAHNPYSEMGVVRDTGSNANSSSSSSGTYNLYVQPTSNIPPIQNVQRASNNSRSSLNSGSKTHNLYTSPNSGSSSVETVPAGELDIEEYNAYKTEIARIMKNFSENKICFIAPDGHEIRMPEYYNIAKYAQAGANPADYMKGEAKKFKIGYKKETKMYNVSFLFMPIFKACEASPTQEADAPQTTSKANLERMLLTKQGLFSEQANTPPHTATAEETKENNASVK